MRRLCKRGSASLGVLAALLFAPLHGRGAQAAQTEIPSGTTTTVSGTTQSYGSGVNINGTLAISNGGIVYADDYSNLATVPTNAFLTVSGAGSQFNLTYHDLNIGSVSGANSTISVTNGGTVSLDSNFNAGNAAGTTTTIIVDGAGSTFTSGFQLGLGGAAGSLANVTVSNGGLLYAQARTCCDVLGEGVLFIGVNGTANVNVTGAGSKLMTDYPYLWVGSIPIGGTSGTGTLTVSNGGSVDVGSGFGFGYIYLAYEAGSKGTLNIGAPAGQAPAAPGTVNASSIYFGSGNGSIVFNHTSDNYTFAPAILGPGSVLVEHGTTILTGTSFYTGPTTINGGNLRVMSSVTGSDMFVNAGGTLSGIGTIEDATINRGGTLAPGTPTQIGALNTFGALTFASGATYKIKLKGSTSDSTQVGDVATLGGAKVHVVAQGSAPAVNQRYTILTAASSVVGTFAPVVSSNLAFFAPTLSYDANDVYLTGAYDYVLRGATQNQRNLGAALNEAAKVSSTNRFFDALDRVPTARGAAVLDSLSGEGITASQNLANRAAQMFNDAIFDQTTFYGGGGAGNQVVLTAPQPGFTASAPLSGERMPLGAAPVRELADLPAGHIEPTFVAPTRTWRAWGSGFGGVEDIHGNAGVGSATQNDVIYGGTLGVDYQLLPNYLVGVAVGGSDGSFSVPARTTWGSTTGGHIAFYDLATFGAFYGASSTSFSYFNNRTTRSVAGFGGLGSETERGTFDSHAFGTRLEFGRHFDHVVFGGGTLTPFVALEISELRSNGFTETSVSGTGAFRLAVSGQSAANVPGSLGLRFQNAVPLGGLTFLPSVQLAWVHQFAPYRSQIGTIADLPGATFLVDGARPARDAAQVKAGGELRLGPHASLFANFDGEFSGVNQLYAGKGGLRWVW